MPGRVAVSVISAAAVSMEAASAASAASAAFDQVAAGKRVASPRRPEVVVLTPADLTVLGFPVYFCV